MFDKMLNIIKEKDIIIPRLLLLNYKNLDLTDQEFIMLIYLLNTSSTIYNPKDISESLKLEIIDVLTVISNLQEKGFLVIEMVQKGNKKAEIIKLDSLYEKLAFFVINEEKEEDTSIYSIFESEFARSLSPMEYSIINAWKEANYSDEVIIEALKEATYNGVSNLKYIDKILDDWSKKGIKNKGDVEKQRKQFKEQKSKASKKEVFTYDWLNDEE